MDGLSRSSSSADVSFERNSAAGLLLLAGELCLGVLAVEVFVGEAATGGGGAGDLADDVALPVDTLVLEVPAESSSEITSEGLLSSSLLLSLEAAMAFDKKRAIERDWKRSRWEGRESRAGEERSRGEWSLGVASRLLELGRWSLGVADWWD